MGQVWGGEVRLVEVICVFIIDGTYPFGRVFEGFQRDINKILKNAQWNCTHDIRFV